MGKKEPLNKDAYEHFKKKLERREKFRTKEERDKMIRRVNEFDRGFQKKYDNDWETEQDSYRRGK